MTDFIIKKLPYDLSSPVPSSPTLRQRLDAQASAWFDLASSINTRDVPTSVEGLSWWTGIIMLPNVALGQGAVWQ